MVDVVFLETAIDIREWKIECLGYSKAGKCGEQSSFSSTCVRANIRTRLLSELEPRR